MWGFGTPDGMAGYNNQPQLQPLQTSGGAAAGMNGYGAADGMVGYGQNPDMVGAGTASGMGGYGLPPQPRPDYDWLQNNNQQPQQQNNPYGDPHISNLIMLLTHIHNMNMSQLQQQAQQGQQQQQGY